MITILFFLVEISCTTCLFLRFLVIFLSVENVLRSCGGPGISLGGGRLVHWPQEQII
jgi:hypothetical protein